MGAKGVPSIISAIGLLIVGAGAVAQPETLGQSFNPANQFSCPDEIIVGEGVRTSRICPEYDKTKTCAGEQDVPLKIMIIGQARLRLLAVSLPGRPSSEGTFGEQTLPLTFSQLGRPTTKQTVPPTTEYTCKMNVSSEAKARKYQVKLDLQYPNESPFSEQFSLKVCGGGGIKISDDSPKVIPCFTGQQAWFRLKLSNAFEQYPVNVREIKIRAKPASLIEPQEQSIPFTRPKSIKHQEDNPFDITFTLASISAEQLFLGFDTDSRILLDFVYDDGEARELVDLKEIKLEVRPNVTVSLMAILTGVLAGCLVKICLQYLEKKQRISRREQLLFILATATVGILLSLVALFGNVQLVAFKLEGSSSDPRVLFTISLAVTVIGSQLIYSWFKWPKSRESQGQANA